jgi:hypothetical protein
VAEAAFLGVVLVLVGAAAVTRQRHLSQLRADPLGRVRLGAARLDTAYPRWAEQVDTQRLNLRSSHTCVLGQVFGTYGNGLDALGIAGMGRRYGFVALGDRDMHTLASFWNDEVTQRRRNAARRRAVEEARARRRQWASILRLQEEWEYDEPYNYKRQAYREKVFATA